jgi:hypothetical protein
MALGARAELALARGDADAALGAFDAAVTEMRAVRFPGAELTGAEPWVVLAESTALTAYVRHAATSEHRRRRDELGVSVSASAQLQLVGSSPVDYPVAGMALAAVGVQHLEKEPDVGVRLLALARGFGYNQAYPVMAWAALRSLADSAAPGRLDLALEEYDGRRGRQLRGEALRVLGLTSSG